MDHETELYKDVARAALEHYEAMATFERVDREDFPMAEKAFKDMGMKRYELALKLLAVKHLLKKA